MSDLDGMEVQRVHGDLHLGQTLRTAIGWKIVDFEGEPAKPLASASSRTRRGATSPGCCAASTTRRRWCCRTCRTTQTSITRAEEWAERNKNHFLHAYAGAELSDDQRTLLDGYVADKAVYEAVYETRNRPAWVHIPLRALARSPESEPHDPQVQGRRSPTGHKSGQKSALKVPAAQLDQLVRGEHGSPHSLLGPHPHDGAVTVRAFKPLARTVVVRHGDGRDFPLEHEREGVWVGVLPDPEVPDYRLEVSYEDGHVARRRRRLPLSAHPRRDRPAPDQRGTARAALAGARRSGAPLPAPCGDDQRHLVRRLGTNARAATVVGDFNGWDGREHPLRQPGTSGDLELFVPGVGNGTDYQYLVHGADGHWRREGRPARVRSRTAAGHRIAGVQVPPHVWRRRLAGRAAGQAARQRADVGLRDAPRLVATRRTFWTYDELADELPAYLADLGFTHVELMPVMQHPFGGSWGYHVTSYFAPDARFGDPDGFRRLVDRLPPGRRRRHPRLGARPLRDRRVGAGAVRRHAALRAPEPAARLAPGVGLAHLRLRPARGPQLPGTPTRSTGSRSSTPTGCGSTASRRCSTSTTRASRASGRRTSTAATRTSRPSSSSRRSTPPSTSGRRASTTIAEESTSWPRVTGPTSARRARVRLQVEHGLDARLARLPQARPRPPRLPPQRDDVRARLRLVRELRAAAEPRRGRARQGLAAAEDAGRRVAASWRTSAPTSASCGRTPASSWCSWAPRWARSRSGPSRASWTGGCSTDPGTAGVPVTGARPEPRLRRAPGAVALRTTSPMASPWIDANDAGHNIFSFVRRADAG